MVCTPIGKYPQADSQLISAWESRKREDGTIVHCKGNPAQKQQTTPPWSTAGLKNFIGKEQIEAEVPRIFSENTRELEEAEGMVRNRAANRYINSLATAEQGHKAGR